MPCHFIKIRAQQKEGLYLSIGYECFALLCAEIGGPNLAVGDGDGNGDAAVMAHVVKKVLLYIYKGGPYIVSMYVVVARGCMFK